MIAKEKIYGLIQGLLTEKDEVFMVSLDVSPTNKITLLIDSHTGIKVDDCVKFSRAIEYGLNREEEDFELEVSSPGVGFPFKVHEQYLKNVGRRVKVIMKEGTEQQGKLTKVDDSKFEVDVEIEVKTKDKKKKKKLIIERRAYSYNDVSKVSVVLKI